MAGIGAEETPAAEIAMVRSLSRSRMYKRRVRHDREDYGEERINLLGMCEGVIRYVTYTESGERIRTISARRAERHEQDGYYRENSR
jgi:uncharacterized DUF497 family protein